MAKFKENLLADRTPPVLEICTSANKKSDVVSHGESEFCMLEAWKFISLTLFRVVSFSSRNSFWTIFGPFYDRFWTVSDVSWNFLIWFLCGWLIVHLSNCIWAHLQCFDRIRSSHWPVIGQWRSSRAYLELCYLEPHSICGDSALCTTWLGKPSHWEPLSKSLYTYI